MQFFYQLLKIDTWNKYGILFFVEQLTFFCRAVDFFKKSVEQSVDPDSNKLVNILKWVAKIVCS
jgi:hypothetical protein